MSDDELRRPEPAEPAAEPNPEAPRDQTPRTDAAPAASLNTDAAAPVAPGDDIVAGVDEPFSPASSPDSLRVLVSCVLAWAVPGLGHVAAGRFGRGLLFAIVVLSLFVGGIALHGEVHRPEPGAPLTYLAAAGAAGVGLPYVAAHSLGRGLGDVRTPSYEYGNTFTLVAGLLNLLIVLDAYDVALGRR